MLGALKVELGFCEGEWFEPLRAAPAVGEGMVFQPVNVGVAVVGEAGLERAKKIVGLPAVGERAQGEARQLGERVVSDGLAAVEEEGNAVAREHTAQRSVMVIERAEDDGAVAEASVRADVAEDFAGGMGGFSLGVGADGEAKCRRLEVAGTGGGRSPVGLEFSEDWVVTETAVRGVARQFFRAHFAVWQSLDALDAIAVSAADGGPEGEPALGIRSLRVEAEGECGVATEREHGAEQIHFLRRHLGEAVEPQAADAECGIRDPRGGEVEQLVGVLSLALLQPLVVGAEQVVEVVEFVAERGVLRATLGEAGETGGRELVALELTEELAELTREAGQTRGGAEDAERGLLAGEQRAQHHHAALVVEEFGNGAEGFEQPAREAVKGNDLQA